MLQRLADSGEEALQKFIADLPGGNKVVGAANSLFARVDELTKRMRSLDPLERRVAELERRLDALSKPAAKPRAKPKSAAARKPARPLPQDDPELGRNPQPQRPRHDLEPHRRRPGLLPVELDRQRLGRRRPRPSRPRSSSAFGCGRCVPR